MEYLNLYDKNRHPQSIKYDFFSVQGDDIVLNIRLQPNAKRTGIEGIWNQTHLKIALAAPAVDGKANEALFCFLSELFNKRKAEISLISGQTSRSKKIKIQTIPADFLLSQIGKL